MVVTTMRGLLVSTFLIGAVPAVADTAAVPDLPGSMGPTSLGMALVDVRAMPIYTFDQDADGKSMCNGDCATEWPPLPVADGAVPSQDWSVVLRDDATRMWAYKGLPVYTFVDDKAGQVTGDGKDGFHLVGLSDADRAKLVAASFAVAIMGITTMGPAWVDSKGMALYTFEKDVGDKSMCNGDCATEWPPLVAVDGSVATGNWTIVVRDDGSKMWAFKGHPLYTFVDDKAAGEVTGDNVDGFHLAI